TRQVSKEDRRATQPRTLDLVHSILPMKVARRSRSCDRLSRCRSAAQDQENLLVETTTLEQRRRARLSDRIDRGGDLFAIANPAHSRHFPRAKLQDGVLLSLWGE